jgi:hypothetical protein
MSAVKGTLSVLLCGATLALAGTPAFAKTYDVAEIGNGFAITGSIVTDGHFGVLSSADILSWDLTVFASGVAQHLIGPSSVVPIEQIELVGSGLTADNFGLFFNFGDPNFSLFRFDQIDQNKSLIGLIEFESQFIQLNIKITDIFGTPISGVVIPPAANLQFAIDPTAVPAAVPLPAALPLFAAGLGALGLLGRRRKKKLAA